MPAKYKIVGLDEALRQVQANMKKTFRTKLEALVKEYLEEQIASQIDASGEKMPKKSPATIKEYQKHGYNTEQFLVRTGESVKLKTTINGDVMFIQPEGYKILANLIPSRVDWMTLNDEAVQKITDLFMKELSKEFK